MNVAPSKTIDTGLEVVDLQDDPSFARRSPHPRDAALQMAGMHRLARAFVEKPETILQELVNLAVELCGADSAGISMERENRTDENYYHWVATAGEYSGFTDALLPRSPSACGVCLERSRPQLLRVHQPFFDLMGIQAPLVTDGLLLPWQVEETRGTIWIMAHARTEAFDGEDCRMMQVLASFAAMGVRQHRQQKQLLEQASAAAAAEMANQLAHKINNPLQGLTNLMYLLTQRVSAADAILAQEMTENLHRLSSLVGELLSLPAAIPVKQVDSWQPATSHIS